MGRLFGNRQRELVGLRGTIGGHELDPEWIAPGAQRALREMAEVGAPGERPGGGWRVMLASTVATLAVVMLMAVAYGLPSKSDPWAISSISSEGRINVTFLDAKGNFITHRGYRQEATVPLNEMPSYLADAVVAVEDRRFYDHWGVDMRGVLRAMIRNMKEGRIVQGASTISQQLARNLYLGPERTFMRKAQETALAFWLERNLPKRQILELYLNRVYLGGGAYGVEAAAQVYFDKSARDLTLAEAVMIAGLPKAPSLLSPMNNLELAHARANVVLEKMVETGSITRAEADAAKAHPAQLSPQARARDLGAEYFVDWAFTLIPGLVDRPPRELVITTTIDRRLQRMGEKAINETLDGVRPPIVMGQGALVAMDREGAVRAMVGGRDYLESQFNRAVQAKRQPGSSFKPFVYLAALRNGYTPYTAIVDKPIRVGTWRPTNANGGYVGWVQMRNALAYSINTVAVRLALTVGIDKVADVAHSLGITTRLPEHPSMALGAMEVRLLELTGAYVPFANGGYVARPYGIEEIRTIDGELLYKHEPEYAPPGEDAPPVEAVPDDPDTEDKPVRISGMLVTPAAASTPEDGGAQAEAETAVPEETVAEETGPRRARVLTADEAEAMSYMLSRVVTIGTGRRARLWTRPAAGKTGTTTDNRDAWFVGFTGDLVAGVWFGNDDATPMYEGRGGYVQGGRQPAAAWRAFMMDAHKGLPPRHLDGSLIEWSGGETAAETPEEEAPEAEVAAAEAAPRVAAGRLRMLLLDLASSLSHAQPVDGKARAAVSGGRSDSGRVRRDMRDWAD